MVVRKMRVMEFNSVLNLMNYMTEDLESRDPVDDDAILEAIKKMAVKTEACFFVAFDNSRPVGFIGGFGGYLRPWNKAVNCHIEIAYLLPEFRTKENIQELVQAFEDWANLAKAKYITASGIGIREFDDYFNDSMDVETKLYIKEL